MADCENAPVEVLDRKKELNAIYGLEVSLLDIYGEAGIGKSSLMSKAAGELRSLGVLVLQVDFLSVARVAPRSRPEQFLRALIAERSVRFSGIWESVDQVAALIISQLIDLSDSSRHVYLMFDTTEAVQEDADFWRWLETRVVAPAIYDGSIRVIVAGRLPAPWRQYESRSVVKYMALGPLAEADAAPELVMQVVRQRHHDLAPDLGTTICTEVYDLTFGHPFLSRKAAEWVAQHLEEALNDIPGLTRELSEVVVAPFIRDYLLEGVDEVWRGILRWASILDDFDADVLKRYLAKVDAELVTDKDTPFFIEGIATLRIRHALIEWREGTGYRLVGVIKNIVCRNFKVMDPEGYRMAHIGMGQVYHEMAAGFDVESGESKEYEARARSYEERVENAPRTKEATS